MTLMRTDCGGGEFYEASSAPVKVPGSATSPQAEPTAVDEPDEGKYLQLLELAVPAVQRFVAQRIANKSDAEDIAQQVLLQAVANLATFRGKSFRAWLFTISRHLIIDHYRARSRVQFVEVAEEALREAEPSLRTREDAVHARCDCRAWLGGWIECITRQLRLEEQVAVLLADVHGYSDKDSAEKLGMTLPSFKLLLHGARVRLNEVSGGNCVLLRTTVAGVKALSPCNRRECGRGCTCDSARERCISRVGERTVEPAIEQGPSRGCSHAARQCETPRGGGVAPCCLGCETCVSSRCTFGVNCRLGIKCCRLVPKLMALRTVLLQALILNPN